MPHRGRPKTTIMIYLDHLTYTYPGHRNAVFQDFELQLEPGHIYGLLGSNGAGKSTLLYLMSGLLTPDGGAARLDGYDVRQRRPATMREIFLVPDEFDLPEVTLQKYIETNAVFYPRFSRDDMNTYLQTFGMTADVHLGGLSLGQRKKIFMSFAMAAHTRVLLMDEPTNGLDIPGKRQFREFLSQGISDERTFIISTHQVKDIETVLDHILIIDRSEIVRREPAAHVLSEQTATGQLIDGHINLEAYFEEAIDGKEVHHD